MDEFDYDFLNSVEIIGYSERATVKLAARRDEDREGIRGELCVTLSPASKTAIMGLGSLGVLWVALDGHWIRNRTYGHLTFREDGVLFVHYQSEPVEQSLGEGTVMIVENATGRILYRGSDGMD